MVSRVTKVHPKVLDYLRRNYALNQSLDDLHEQITEAMTTFNTILNLAKQAKIAADKALSTTNTGGCQFLAQPQQLQPHMKLREVGHKNTKIELMPN
jgi:hypothetical protein